MARLRVGDIEINGDQITIGGRSVAGAAPQQGVIVVSTGATPSAPRPSTELARVRPSSELGLAAKPTNDLAKLPFAPRWWLLGGVAVLVASVVSSAHLFFPGIGLLVLGVLKYRAQREEARIEGIRKERERVQQEAALGPVIDKVRLALGVASAPPTVEQLSQRLGIPQPELVRALVVMRQKNDVVEDLDTESGEWVYSLALRQLPAQDLDARLAALEQQEQESSRRR